MKVSGQLNALAWRKGPQYPLTRRLGGPQKQYGCDGDDKDLCQFQQSSQQPVMLLTGPGSFSAVRLILLLKKTMTVFVWNSSLTFKGNLYKYSSEVQTSMAAGNSKWLSISCCCSWVIPLLIPLIRPFKFLLQCCIKSITDKIHILSLLLNFSYCWWVPLTKRSSTNFHLLCSCFILITFKMT